MSNDLNVVFENVSLAEKAVLDAAKRKVYCPDAGEALNNAFSYVNAVRNFDLKSALEKRLSILDDVLENLIP